VITLSVWKWALYHYASRNTIVALAALATWVVASPSIRNKANVDELALASNAAKAMMVVPEYPAVVQLAAIIALLAALYVTREFFKRVQVEL
jgi:hypothetical protein